jgi:uncharacterized protein
MLSDVSAKKRIPIYFFSYNGKEFCLDPFKPQVLHITQAVRQHLEEMQGRGSAAQGAPEQVPGIAAQIESLRDKGFFRYQWPSPPVDADRSVTKLSLLVTEACNYRCRYCYFTDELHDGGTQKMTKDVAFAAVNLLCKHSNGQTLGINFFGGEPLLNFALIDAVVEYCATKQRDFKYTITTNAALITERIASFFKKHDFVVVASLDGPAGIHNSVRKFPDGRGTCQETIRGIEILQKMLPANKITTNTVITKESTNLDLLLDFLENLKVYRAAFTTISAPKDSELSLDEVTLPSFLCSETKICTDLIHGTSTRNIQYLPILQYLRFIHKAEPRHYRCSIGRETLAVAPNGTLYPCHRFVGTDGFELGTVSTGIKESTRNKFYTLCQDFDNSCGKCWARFLCGGPCAYDSFANSGNIYQPILDKCMRIRNLIAHAAILFGELAINDKNRLVELLS